MSPVNITNRKAFYEYELSDKLITGIALTGSEIKSIRAGKASIKEAYCFIYNGELWLKNMHVAEYVHSGYIHPDVKRDRKLLAKKQEIRKLKSKVEEKGFTLIPTRVFINEKGLAKLEIALAKGKKLHDKRETIKRREMDRAMRRGDETME